MKTLFIDKNLKYDGTQLAPLYAYLNYSVLGDSIISWHGPCDVSFEHMIDGEDLISQSRICGDNMVHFIIEIFDQKLITGVALQRLFASICKDYIQELTGLTLVRDGDDLYWNQKKLSISIAAPSLKSTLIHFALNITNEGTPVSTCSLEDLGINSIEFSKEIMDRFSQEFKSIKNATYKVKDL